MNNLIVNNIFLCSALVLPSIAVSSFFHYNNIKNNNYDNVKFSYKFLNFYLSST